MSSLEKIDNPHDELRLPNIEAQALLVNTHAALAGGVEADIHPAAVALALLRDTSISTSALKAAAIQRISARVPQLHTFVPLYTTNHCDSECKMCAMRKGNTKLVRKFAGKKAIEEQLHILYEHELVRGVGFLTGEYEDPYTRLVNAFRIGWAIRTALDIGFQRIYFNIGSMVPEEIEVLSEWLEPTDPVTMCVFQETYDRDCYKRFMGADPQHPKSDYDRRVRSFDHWVDAGFQYVNPGVLVGLHEDVEAEVVSLVSHVTRLANRGAVVDVSLPRLRPAQGSKNVSGVDDEQYLRIMSIIALVCPDQRLVLTNRESEDFQKEAIDLCGVFSPGSPDVAPYQRSDTLINREESSQFLVADLRRPSQILTRIQGTGKVIDYFAGSAP
jgi:2-iminoacetate synthase